MKKSLKIKILYIVGIIGAVLILFKLFGLVSLSMMKVLDSLNLLIVILIIFYGDYVISKMYNNEIELNNKSNSTIKSLEQQNNFLKDRIKELEDKENENLRLSSYRDRVISRLVNSKNKFTNKHQLLHLFSEIFQGGVIILYKENKQNDMFVVEATYALPEDYTPKSFELGEGLNGQAAKDGKPMIIQEIPEDYISVSSGLGKTNNLTLYLLPIMKEQKCIYLVEMLAFANNDIAKIWNDLADKIVEKEIL